VKQRPDGQWQQSQELRPKFKTYHLMHFGHSVSVHNDRVGIGAHQYSSKKGLISIWDKTSEGWKTTEAKNIEGSSGGRALGDGRDATKMEFGCCGGLWRCGYGIRARERQARSKCLL